MRPYHERRVRNWSYPDRSRSRNDSWSVSRDHFRIAPLSRPKTAVNVLARKYLSGVYDPRGIEDATVRRSRLPRVRRSIRRPLESLEARGARRASRDAEAHRETAPDR